MSEEEMDTVKKGAASFLQEKRVLTTRSRPLQKARFTMRPNVSTVTLESAEATSIHIPSGADATAAAA